MPEPNIGLCSPGILHWEDEPPKRLALKASGAYFRRPRGLWEIETPLLKGTHKISHALDPGKKQ